MGVTEGRWPSLETCSKEFVLHAKHVVWPPEIRFFNGPLTVSDRELERSEFNHWIRELAMSGL